MTYWTISTDAFAGSRYPLDRDAIETGKGVKFLHVYRAMA